MSSNIPSLPSDMVAYLPAEVLLRIFELVSFSYLNPACTCIIPCSLEKIGYFNPCGQGSRRRDVEWKEYEYIQGTWMFPYGIAYVCKQWYKAMRAYPEWWTRLRVFMDNRAPTSILSDFRRQVEFTRSVHPLQLIITNCCTEQELDPSVEQDLVDNVLEIITPHLGRAEKIIIQTTHGSSLPLLSSGVFSDLGPFLKELVLECTYYPIRQSLPAPIVSLGQPSGINFNIPSCSRLTLGGPTFLDVYSFPELWNLLFRKKNISVKISHLRTDASFSLDDFSKSILRMVNIKGLTLEDVELPSSPWDAESVVDEIGPNGLTFNAMASTSAFPFFNGIHLERLSVNNSKMTGIPYPTAFTLFLDNIPEDQCISHAMIHVNPTKAFITNCPGLDDIFLGAICHSQTSDVKGICPRLRALTIKGRTSITPNGLKQFVMGRHQLAEKYFSEKDVNTFYARSIRTPIPLQSLVVVDTGYTLTKEDFNFFVESLHEFKWVP